MTSPRTLLKAWNLYAKKQLGQNFLADPSTADMIVARTGITPEDIVLEIGAGLGALTVPLARAARKVYAVEKDRQLIPLLKSELLAGGIHNVELLQQNILTVDIKALAEQENRPLIVMGNLPYNISSQILIQLVHAREVVSRAVFMFQKELAERIMAPPGNRDYGRLSVVLQYCATIRRLAEVKANLFFPRPKVDSEVIEIRFLDTPTYPADDETLLFEVIKAAFGQRRKTLRNSLSKSELEIDVDTAVQALRQAGIDPTRRAESLNVAEFVRLSNELGCLTDRTAGTTG